MLRRNIPARFVTSLAAAALALAPGAARADEGDGAICQTREVVVKDRSVAVMLEPSLNAARLFTAAKGEVFACGAVERGGEHDWCGASKSRTWMVLTDFQRFDVYVPSHCVADVFR